MIQVSLYAPSEFGMFPTSSLALSTDTRIIYGVYQADYGIPVEEIAYRATREYEKLHIQGKFRSNNRERITMIIVQNNNRQETVRYMSGVDPYPQKPCPDVQPVKKVEENSILLLL